VVGSIEIVNAGRDFPGCPFTNRLFQQPVIVAKLEVDHPPKRTTLLVRLGGPVKARPTDGKVALQTPYALQAP